MKNICLTVIFQLEYVEHSCSRLNNLSLVDKQAKLEGIKSQQLAALFTELKVYGSAKLLRNAWKNRYSWFKGLLLLSIFNPPHFDSNPPPREFVLASSLKLTETKAKPSPVVRGQLVWRYSAMCNHFCVSTHSVRQRFIFWPNILFTRARTASLLNYLFWTTVTTASILIQ